MMDKYEKEVCDSVNLDLKIELLKMEYETCVETYQDIYNSIWKIFSYFSAVTAALLLLGDVGFTINARIALAAIPLFFWWLGIYTPMNKYGDQKVDDLMNIEKELNCLVQFVGGKKLCHFNNYCSLKPKEGSIPVMLKKARITYKPWTWHKIFVPSKWMRVRFAADFLGYLLLGILLYYFIRFFICLISRNCEYFWVN